MAHNMLGTLETPVLAEELVPVPDKQNDAAEIGPAWLHLSRRGLWIALGVSFLLIGAVGVFLPLIPTTGPLIVAAWAFAKGSPALHRWLLSNRLFGPFMAAFSLIPAQNASGNWIKVVQRVPVRITLDPADLAKHPLRVGLSMKAKIDVAK